MFSHHASLFLVCFQTLKNRTMLSLSFSSILRPRGGLSLASAVLLGLLVGQLVITVTEAEPEPRRRSRGRGKVAKMEETDLEDDAGSNREEKCKFKKSCSQYLHRFRTCKVGQACLRMAITRLYIA